jgi:feruloyl esterase
VQAAALNKIWFGMTSDGSVPSPATDNGWAASPTGLQRWYGLTRGTSLYAAFYAAFFPGFNGLTGVNGPFTIASDQVALELQNPTIASTNFQNATGNGADGWKS